MQNQTRREFFGEVGQGMFIAGLGATVAADLGLADQKERETILDFGADEPLVRLLQETPLATMLPVVVKKIREGTTLRQLTGAAALANARAFGGEDYIGFHTLMALGPAYEMAKELRADQAPLPVLKVLYRNTANLQSTGGCSHSTLKPVPPFAAPPQDAETALREAVRRKDVNRAEALFAAMAQGTAEQAYDHLLPMVEDGTEVHRVVLAYRAWELLGLVGKERAHTLLRQSVRYCAKNEGTNYERAFAGVRTVLPRLLDQYQLHDRPKTGKTAEDAWVNRLSETIFNSSPERAAEAVAGALGEGFSPNVVAEAIALAANQLLLRDVGRTKQYEAHKPVGSVHGDSIGVHACDSANAWCNIARAASPRHTMASLVLAGFQVALDRDNRGGDFFHWAPYPRAEHLKKFQASDDPDALLKELDGAIRAKDQIAAAVFTSRYGEAGRDAAPLIALLRSYAVSQDGALHAEKFYHTATEEFARSRPAFRWRQLIALARVTASAYGYPAPGHAEAVRLLRS